MPAIHHTHPALASAVRKAHLRLAPLLALMFALAMLDRSNVGFIAPTLKTAIETAFGSQQAGMIALAAAGFIGVLLLQSLGSSARKETGAKTAPAVR